jgi:hypothetical protein
MITTFLEYITEKKKNWIKTDPSKAGMFDGWTVTDLEAEKEELKASNARLKEQGKPVSAEKIERMAQINFALRAKKGHGFKKKK